MDVVRKPGLCGLIAFALAACVAAGCGGGSAQHPPQAGPQTDAVRPPDNAPAPGTTPGAPPSGQALSEPVPTTMPTTELATGWRYRFDMTTPPNDNFAITDRNVYLYFKPDTAAVHFQMENRRGVAGKILWDECTFTDVNGRTFKAAHRGITYDRRDQTQEVTWVQPGQRYADYLIPVDVLSDPNAATGGGQRTLLPTDLRAQSMVGRVFGCKLVIGSANDDLRLEYDVHFKIASTYRE